MATLAEELLLLALDDKKGSVPLLGVGEALDPALAGAQLMELALAEHIRIENNRVIADPGTHPSDPVLRHCLERISAEKKLRKPDTLVLKLMKGLRKRLLEQLVDEGVVTVDKGHALGFIPVTRYPEADGRTEREVRSRVRSAILDGAEPDRRTTALVALLRGAGLEKLVLSKDEKKAAKDRIKHIAQSDPLVGDVGRATAAALASISAAAVSAGTTAAIVS